MELKQTRNNSIDIFRYFCAMLIVAIHTHPGIEFGGEVGFFTYKVFTRIAVPFFFAVSGYYFVGSLQDNKKVLWKTVKKLLIVYAVWSVIYIVYDLIQLISKAQPITPYLKQLAVDIFTKGTYYQMWFIPSLIIAILVTYLFHKLKLLKFLAIISVFLVLLGAYCTLYFHSALSTPIIKDLLKLEHYVTIRRTVFTAIPFFSSGYFLQRFSGKLSRISNKKLIITVSIIFTLFLAEIIVGKVLKIISSAIITTFLYPLVLSIILLLLKNPMPNKSKTSEICRKLSNFTYYSHPLFIFLITNLKRVITGTEMIGIPMFVSTVFVTALVGLLLIKQKNKTINLIFL